MSNHSEYNPVEDFREVGAYVPQNGDSSVFGTIRDGYWQRRLMQAENCKMSQWCSLSARGEAAYLVRYCDFNDRFTVPVFNPSNSDWAGLGAEALGIALFRLQMEPNNLSKFSKWAFGTTDGINSIYSIKASLLDGDTVDVVGLASEGTGVLVTSVPSLTVWAPLAPVLGFFEAGRAIGGMWDIAEHTPPIPR